MLKRRTPLASALRVLFRQGGGRSRAAAWAALLTLLALMWQTILRPVLMHCWPECAFPEISADALGSLLELLADVQP